MATAQSGGDDRLATTLRAAMRRMPSAVALVTTCDPATRRPAGLAASAVIPVSMEPPSMLVAINQRASTHPAIAAAGRFCINLIGTSETALVEAFADGALRERRFAEGRWHDRDGVPYLADVPASLFCRTAQRLVFGTHELFIGTVEAVILSEHPEPLGWIEGGFARLGPIDPAAGR